MENILQFARPCVGCQSYDIVHRKNGHLCEVERKIKTNNRVAFTNVQEGIPLCTSTVCYDGWLSIFYRHVRFYTGVWILETFKREATNLILDLALNWIVLSENFIFKVWKCRRTVVSMNTDVWTYYALLKTGYAALKTPEKNILYSFQRVRTTLAPNILHLECLLSTVANMLRLSQLAVTDLSAMHPWHASQKEEEWGTPCISLACGQLHPRASLLTYW